MYSLLFEHFLHDILNLYYKFVKSMWLTFSNVSSLWCRSKVGVKSIPTIIKMS